MQSSSGKFFITLDHVRALALFMVFTWHFTHGGSLGFPVPYNYVPTPALFPLSLLDEGHTGVALFMTLSGYLFAKLLDGQTIDYRAFLWNRAVRLLPLLTAVILVVGVGHVVKGAGVRFYASQIAAGVLLPSLPNGGWSITTEFHYYLILPVFLWMIRKSRWLPVLIIVVAVALRSLILRGTGEVQRLAYWTIVGRIDQFALGMLIFQCRSFWAHRHVLAIGALSTFAAFYWYFDFQGGLYHHLVYPSPSPLWVIFSTIEGAAYAIGIAWYDNSFAPADAGVSRFIGRIGAHSYSLYLLHFFIVFWAAKFVHEHIMDISNFSVACLWSVICLLLILPVGYLSYHCIEAPFLKLRRRYAMVVAGE